MKKDIHPTYYSQAVVTCSGCGTTWTTGSTMEKIQVEICSSCHPFYTGQDKTLDTAGRVERFRSRQSKAEPKKKTAKAGKKEAEAEPAAVSTSESEESSGTE